jgi:enoyl-[acyl-carrier protein] reductase I
MFADIKAKWGSLDYVVHSIAYAPRPAMEGRYIETTQADWTTALQVSAYSLVAVAREAEPLLSAGGSIITLTYYASEKVVPKYNVMGVAKAALEASVRYLAYELGSKNIRVNAVSAGAARTVAAMSIPGFRKMTAKYNAVAPLKRMISHEEVGNLGFYLLSPLSSGTTGQTVYVDAGYSVMGMDLGEE